MLLGLSLNIDAENNPQHPHSEQNAANPKWIRHRIAHPHLIDHRHRCPQVAQDLLPCPQRWRIGDRAGKNPQHDRQWNIKQFMQDGGNQTTDDDDQNSKQVEA
ncbi:hypothetical protein ExPUPEC119_00759 [Escherichia coli]|nr:hypothetical protein ExPUPEC119_00759 [Escherichia coli]